MSGIVTRLDVRPERVRIGLMQFADTQKTEFYLNSHTTKQDVLANIAQLRLMGGNVVRTGAALQYAIANHFQASAGSRRNQGVQQVLILITGASSQDEVKASAEDLKTFGVLSIAIGLKNAVQRELESIAYSSRFLFNLPVFGELLSVQLEILSFLKSKMGTEPPTIIGKNCSLFADIVFLVDGSINLGKDNFKEVMEFIVNLIDLFFTEQDNLQIGLAHYASDVTDVFYLNTYNNKDDIINAIGRAEYKGGRRINTGNAIKHIQQAHFVKEKGSRKDEGVPQILMIVTGGRSQDDGKSAALGLKATGVRIYAVGVGDIEDELNDLGSETTTVARASTFQELSELNEQILETLDDEIMGIKLCTGVKDTAKGESIN
ncbi:collagen alpha-3(VI) chain [Astyanax mexicanus]|uniref:Collagen alpha-3(VI) chain n=1 Tax=Astyanax mexicanus TaxID=7994 RepID=A0A8T2LGY7_ASTMX|nr:collagen alpha-3(VI) chain [Astyanax mexicanus]